MKNIKTNNNYKIKTMTPIPLEDKITASHLGVDLERQELEKQFLKMPELDQEEEITKRLNDINTFMAHKNEVCLRGTDEHGKDFTIWFDSYDFLKWIDKEQLEYIKEQLTKYIKTK